MPGVLAGAAKLGPEERDARAHTQRLHTMTSTMGKYVAHVLAHYGSFLIFYAVYFKKQSEFFFSIFQKLPYIRWNYIFLVLF